MARGDFIEHSGAAVVTDSLTFVGSGGIDTVNAPIKHGATTIITHGLVTNVGLGNSVDGKLAMLAYHHTAAGTDSSTPMHSLGATATHYGPMPKAGSVVGWNWHVTAALTGTETIGLALQVGATASVVVVSGVTSASSGYASFAKDAVAFAAGKKLLVNYTCTHWGAAHNIQANLFVEM